MNLLGVGSFLVHKARVYWIICFAEWDEDLVFLGLDLFQQVGDLVNCARLLGDVDILAVKSSSDR